MGVPLRQTISVARYLMTQRLRGREKFPLIVELEPLYACNLACAGCGKIQHPVETLRKRMPVEQAVAAVEECGAPMVSIAGGEPLVHPEIHKITDELVRRRKFVYLCTNALMLERKLSLFTPSPYFAFAIHIDGLRERHDESVCQEGVFDKAVEAIKAAKHAGFRVTTNTTFFTHDTPQNVRAVLDFLNDELEVDHMMISPATPMRRPPTRSTSYRSSRPSGSSAKPFAAVDASAGGSITARSSSISSKARSTTTAPPGHSELFHLWLAAALLPDGGRLRRHL